MRLNRRTLLATGASAATLASLGLPARAQEPLKVGFIYVGPIGDGGWTYQHDQGRLAVEEHFGDAVETIYQESVPEGADAERAITQMVLSGARLIFTTSFGFMDATGERGRAVPDVKFEHATGYKRLDNLATYDARLLRGARGDRPHRGRMTKTNKIGYIAPSRSPR
jgi:simple sugar transport system substrate-binding protein